MTRHVFGWSYPPGAANDPLAPYNQVDPPCAVCGNFEDACLCPECSVCGAIGDETCYAQHGLMRTQAQVDSLAAAEKRWAAENDCSDERLAYDERLEDRKR